MSDYPAVSVFCPTCAFQHHAVERCFEEKCCWAWQREAKEKREKNQKEVADV